MNTTAERHLTDAEMMRVLDGETEASAHLEWCERCASAMDTLRTESARVGDWLDRAAFEADPPDPAAALREVQDRPRRAGDRARPAQPDPRPGLGAGTGWRPARRRWLQAAAILLLLAAPLAAIPGVRAWVAARVASEPAAAPETAVEAAVVLRFTPAPGDFAVTFPAGATGTLAFERSEGEEAELRALGGEPETVVSASSLEIRNTAVGRYELRLPEAVTSARVRVGDRAVTVSDAQIGRGTVIELGR